MILLPCLMLGLLPATAATLEQQVLTKIQAATFEVVAAKPTADPLTYARPLPFELLPFQERNDKYFSIGTAFAIGNNRYVTAAHVLDVGIGSLWGTMALRDSNGHVFAIDKIEKFSLPRDFAVFSVIGRPDPASLEMDTRAELNSVVYAVGNALGTGVVVRDGLLTSKTPEEQDGRWTWLRFSAAASPGNSGGPLVNDDGTVIGIVLRKSQNENLNYALPIEEVIQAPEHLADIDNRGIYRLDVFDSVQVGTFEAQFSLPLAFREFSATVEKLANAYSDSQLKALLIKEPEKMFPGGPGSNRLLHSVPRMGSFPAVISRQRDGQWVLVDKKGEKTPLSSNGYVISGTFGRTLLFHLRRPDDISAAQIYTDAEELAGQLLKTGFMQRMVGSEKVPVTGLGKPTEDSVYVDVWQRRWQVRSWPLPFANQFLITVSLPVPDGYVVMAQYAAAGSAHETLIDLKATTDFINAGYWGTLAQWKDFLASAPLQSTLLKSIKLSVDYGHAFSIESKHVSVAFGQELQTISPESQLGLGFAYVDDHGNFTWDVGDIELQRTTEVSDQINIQRHLIPSDGLDENYKAYWEKMIHREHPYDGVSYTESDQSRITAMVGSQTPNSSVLYSAFVGVSGVLPQQVMQERLNLLLKNLRAAEY